MMDNIIIRKMLTTDYEQVHSLWRTIKGFGIRSIDDSKDGVIRFIQRNPNTSIVAIDKNNDNIVGAILCGHDGRQACFYHVCVDEKYRRQGIGKAMVVDALNALMEEHISKVALFAFTQNEIGNMFWKNSGWTKLDNMNAYEFILNKDNITEFIESN